MKRWMKMIQELKAEVEMDWGAEMDKGNKKLVLCKECEWWENDTGRCKLFSFGKDCTTVTMEDDFCSRGTKKGMK